MQIDKDKILEFMRSQGQADQAQEAEGQLPDQVDTDNPEHHSLLEKLGLKPDVIKNLAGGLGKFF